MPDTGISDTQARERAVDPTGSFIVQAPAGSGKTELLIQRFLALLAVVNEPEEILAITFTRKAAAEMRHRVVEALERGRDDTPPETDHERKTWKLAREALERDRDAEWNLIDMPGRLRIRTIDSLCYSLTQQMPVTSEMGGEGSVEDDTDDLYREAARAALAEVESDDVHAQPITILLEHLGNRVDRAESLLVTMLKTRGQWLRHVVEDQERDVLERALRGAVEEHLEGVAARIPGSFKEEIVILYRYAAKNLANDGRESAVLAGIDLEAFPPPDGDSLNVWKGLAVLLLTTTGGTWRKQRNVTLGFPSKGSASDPIEKEFFQSMKDRHAALIASLSDIEGLEEALAAVADLPPVAYSDDQWYILQALFELLARATVHLEAVFGTRGVLDHQEIQQRALTALGEEQRPTDLTLRLDYKISHILVDEFQDTSRGQFALLKRLTAGWEPHDGRTLFLVGDPMQSIYRFREAEVALFLHAWTSGIGDVSLEPLTLKKNFRSRDEVVGWVNEGFPSVLTAESDEAKGAVSYASSKATRGSGGAVKAHPFYERDDAAEAKHVAEIIQARLEELDDPEQTIAVLVRSRTHLSAIVPALREAGIRFRGVDLEKLGERPEVLDLLALTRALLHPADRTAWVAVLRAPWCGLSLADLTALLSEDRFRTVPALIADETITSRLSQDGRKRLTRLRQAIDGAWEDRRRRRLARWIEGVWLAIGGPATMLSPVGLEAARVFFDLLQKHEEGGDLLDFDALQQAMDTIYAPPDPSEDIQVELMTIHGAKGLEFNTVIMPGLGKRTRGDDPQLLRWLEHPVRGEDAMLMAPIRGAFQDEQDPIYTFIQKLDEEQSAYEEGRLLYVAATRARERLHLLGHADVKPESGALRRSKAGGGRLDEEEPVTPPSNTLLETLWPAVSSDFKRNISEEAEESHEKDEMENSLPQSIRRLMMEWDLPSVPASAPLPARVAPDRERETTDEWDGGDRTARHVGTVVHRALMRIARDGLSQWDAEAIRRRRPFWERALRELGVPREEEEILAGRVVDALEQTLQDDRGRWILDDHDQARSEYAVTGVLGGPARRSVIDRTFVADGTRWIIDFKTGRPEDDDLDAFLETEKERYQDQLEGYARLFEDQGLPIQLGLYFPLAEGWEHWPFEGTV